MASIKLENFGGMVPITDPRLLPQGLGQVAENTWLYSGSLQGFNTPAAIRNTSAKKVFRIPPSGSTDYTQFGNSTWIEFNDIDTDVVRAPMINDQFQRYYWASPSTGPMFNTLARIQSGQPPYRLGIVQPRIPPLVTATASTTTSTNVQQYTKDQAPPAAGTATDNGTVTTTDVVTAEDGSSTVTTTTITPNLPEVRAYSYTWVSEYGEESPPSPPFLVTGDLGSTWTVVMFAPDQLADRSHITKTRIYRTVTSAAGVATYFFVAELLVDILVYIDGVADDICAGQGLLETTSWALPPQDMQGMVAMPNGMLVGWTGHDVYFCEPYRPHAWPAEYAVSVEHPIVGIGVFGSNIVIATTGTPVVAYGVHPSNVALSKINAHEPCLSRGSIVSNFDSVVYASQNGLIQVQPGTAVNVTSTVIAPKQWQTLFQPEKLRAVRYQRAYLALPSGDATVDMGVIIDSTDARVAFNLLPTSNAMTNIQEDIWTGEIFMLDSGQVKHFNPTGAPMLPWRWKSKQFQYLKPVNMEAMRVWFRVPPGAAQPYGHVKLYADGVLRWERDLVNSAELMRLPSGFKAEVWEVELTGVVEIMNLQMASSAKELGSV